MYIRIILILILTSTDAVCQTNYTSSKYNYSLTFPNSWTVKENIINPNVDCKIVDGLGNSFVVSIVSFPTSTKLTAKQQMNNMSNNDLEQQFNSIYGTTKVIKRGTIFIDLKEFYYLHLLTPFSDDSKLYHKMFLFNEGYKMLSIDACSVDNFINQTTPAFAIMISTFKFTNLKIK